MKPTAQIAIRLARLEESDACADLWLRSRLASYPAMPAPDHDDLYIHFWMRLMIAMRGTVWVAEGSDQLLAVMALYEDGEFDQLYVDPQWTGHGIGTRLVEFAKKRNPSGLYGWVVQTDTRARRFYERHGFVVIEATDAEKEGHHLDVRYAWTGQTAT